MWEWYTTRVKIRFVVGIIGLFFLSMFMSCQELHYMISSKTVDATMEQSAIEKTSDRRGGVLEKRVVTYLFQDGANYRREYANVPLDWPGSQQKTVKIQYLPGSDRQSRIYGQSNKLWVIIFFGSLVAAGFGIFIIAREK